MSQQKTLLAVVADERGEVFEHPDLLMAGMNGMTVGRPAPTNSFPSRREAASSPSPARPPSASTAKRAGRSPRALCPGSGAGEEPRRFRLFSPRPLPALCCRRPTTAARRSQLPLWSYTAVGWCAEEERFYAAAVRVDRNTQWQPDHFDDRKLDPLVRRILRENPDNRLFEQLARCALDYHCFAAKNLFFRRWEAPLPTSPACNSRCLGCISLQESDCCPVQPGASELRSDGGGDLPGGGAPSAAGAKTPSSPSARGARATRSCRPTPSAAAVREMRRATSRGTVNFNSNASLPEAVERLAGAGIDSIRISLNSVQEPLYNAYYRPRGLPLRRRHGVGPAGEKGGPVHHAELPGFSRGHRPGG